MDCVIDFRAAMTTAFGQLEFLPVADGAIHRFMVPGDRAGSYNGWYLLFADGIASGCFGSWKVGAVHHWNSREPVDHLEVHVGARGCTWVHVGGWVWGRTALPSPNSSNTIT